MESYLLVERWRISKQDHKSRQRKLDLSLMCCWLFVCLGGTELRVVNFASAILPSGVLAFVQELA